MSGGGGGGGRGGGGGGGGCRGHPGGGGADDAAEVYDDSGRNPGEVGGRGGGGGGGGCRGHHGGGGADDAAEVYDDSGRNPGEVVDRLVSRGCTSTAVKRRNSKKNAQARSRLPDERLLSDQYSRFPLESQQQSDPFEGGSFDMDLLFKEFDNDEKDDVTLCYARYCALRAQARLSDKDKDICYICHFKHNKVTPLPKQRIKGHVLSKHKIDGFLCPSRGCLVRASTLSEIGLHHLYCHEKSKEWWVPFLYETGGDSEFLI